MDNVLLFFIVWLLVVGFIILRMWWKAKQNTLNQQVKDQLQNATVLYQDSRSSGRSMKNFKTRYGGAHNCLKIVVTGDRLYVTAPAMLAAFSRDSDLEHIIPKSAIEAVEVKKHWLFRMSYLITYRDSIGEIHTLELVPRRREAFKEALGMQLIANHK